MEFDGAGSARPGHEWAGHPVCWDDKPIENNNSTCYPCLRTLVPLVSGPNAKPTLRCSILPRTKNCEDKRCLEEQPTRKRYPFHTIEMRAFAHVWRRSPGRSGQSSPTVNCSSFCTDYQSPTTECGTFVCSGETPTGLGDLMGWGKGSMHCNVTSASTMTTF